MIELIPNKQLKFTIPLKPVSKKNNIQIRLNKKTGHHYPAPSVAYQQYEKDCLYFMPLPHEITEPVNVRAIFYMPTHGIVDLVNLEEALLDVLVKYRVLKDDNSRIVASMDGSRVAYDKDKPRTEVIIEYVG